MKGGLAWLLAVSATACSFGSEGVGNGQGLGQGDDDDDAPTTGSPMEDSGIDDGIPPTGGDADDDDDDDDDDDNDSTADADDDDDDDDDDSSSDGPDPVCGNRMVEGDEACDDGNEIDHDGCTSACQESGSRIFGHAFGGDPATFEALRAVAYHPDLGTYFSVGFVWGGDGYDTLRVEIDGEGNVDQEQITAAAGDQVDSAIAVSPGGDLVIVGGASNVYRVQQVGTDLSVGDEDTFPGVGNGTGRGWGVAFEPDGAFMTVGSQPSDWSAAFVQKFDNTGAPGMSGTIDNDIDEYFRAVVWDEDSKRYYLAYNIASGTDRVIVLDSDLNETTNFPVDTPGNSVIRTIAVTPDSILVAGYDDIKNVDTAFLDAYTSDGTLKWRYETSGDEGEAFFLAIAVDGEGSIVAGGYQPATVDEIPGEPERIVYKLSPEGGLLWSTTVDIDDNPTGSVQGLTIGPDNVIVGVGTAGTAGTSTGPAAFALNP